MRKLTIATVISLVAATSSAQELERLSSVAENAALSYAPARCGALYQAMMEWIGHGRMGEDVWRQTDEAREFLIVTAAGVSQATGGGSMEVWLENTIRDVRNIANLYLVRFEANYAASGQAFGNDAVVADDLSYCQAWVEEMSQ